VVVDEKETLELKLTGMSADSSLLAEDAGVSGPSTAVDTAAGRKNNVSMADRVVEITGSETESAATSCGISQAPTACGETSVTVEPSDDVTSHADDVTVPSLDGDRGDDEVAERSLKQTSSGGARSRRAASAKFVVPLKRR